MSDHSRRVKPRFNRKNLPLVFALVLLSVVIAFPLARRFRNHYCFLFLLAQERSLFPLPPKLCPQGLQEARARSAIQDSSSRKPFSPPGGQTCTAVVCRKDVDGDGMLDTIAAFDPNTLFVEFTRSSSQYWQTVGLSGIPSVGFDDVDGNGIAEPWWFDVGDDYLGILWHDKGKMTGKQILSFSPGLGASRAAFVNTDGDGAIELVLEVGAAPSLRSKGAAELPIRGGKKPLRVILFQNGH